MGRVKRAFYNGYVFLKSCHQADIVLGKEVVLEVPGKGLFMLVPRPWSNGAIDVLVRRLTGPDDPRGEYVGTFEDGIWCSKDQQKKEQDLADPHAKGSGLRGRWPAGRTDPGEEN